MLAMAAGLLPVDESQVMTADGRDKMVFGANLVGLSTRTDFLVLVGCVKSVTLAAIWNVFGRSLQTFVCGLWMVHLSLVTYGHQALGDSVVPPLVMMVATVVFLVTRPSEAPRDKSE